MCLDVTQLVNVETADLSMDEMGFLELCRSSFKEIEEKLATNKKKTANTDTTTNTDMEKSKRKITNTIKVTPGPRQSKRTKQGQRSIKFRDAANVEAVELDMTADETNGMKVNQFTRKAQIKYIIEEILCRKYTSITLDNDIEREVYRKELEKLDTVKGVKVHLRIILQIDVDGRYCLLQVFSSHFHCCP